MSSSILFYDESRRLDGTLDIPDLTVMISDEPYATSFPPHNLFVDSRASSNPRNFCFRFHFRFYCCFWLLLLLLHFDFHLGSQFKPCTYIHEFLVLRNSHHHHRNGILNSRSQHSMLNNSTLGFITIPFVVSRPFFYFKFSLESTHLYVWFVNLFRGLTNNLFE